MKIQKTTPIHTLDGRTYVLLDVLREQGASSSEIFKSVQQEFQRLVSGLAECGIDYAKLKSALIPQVDRKKTEVAYFFDISKATGSMYGWEFFKPLFAHLNPESPHCIASGDLICANRNELPAFETIQSILARENSTHPELSHEIYVIYINNVTAATVARLDLEASKLDAYMGKLDMKYESSIKTWLSYTLVPSVLKSQNSVILVNDVDWFETDENYCSPYFFKEFDYKIVSVPEPLHGLFLRYKIEAPLMKGFEGDFEHSLNAMSSTPAALSQIKISITEAKLDYLKREKSGSLMNASIENITATELESLLRERIGQNYIFNLRINEQYNALLCSTIIEFPNQVRLSCGLKFHNESQELEITTLY